MIVHCLFGGYYYKGVHLLGVYTSEEKARAAREGIDGYDHYRVETRRLDADAGGILDEHVHKSGGGNYSV